jgi:membrane protein implicated in regulation of membrane protease activity
MSWRKSTFLLPGLIAVLSLAGLFAALLGDGWWDALAWIGLGLPALLSIWPLLRRRVAAPDTASLGSQRG